MKLTKLLILGLVAATGVVVFLPRDAMAAPISLDGFDQTCIGAILDDCTVQSAGYLNTSEGRPSIAFQIQAGSTTDDGTIGSVLLFEPTSDGWTQLIEAHQAYSYDIPAITNSGLLYIGGYTSGTGSFNADLLFNSTNEGTTWQQVDIDSWQNTITEKLPAGLAIWKGVQYDFDDWQNGMVANTSLWRDDDANCCATGGSATIVFDIVDQVLTVTNVIYTAPDKDKSGS